ATVPVETARPAEAPRLPAWVDGGRSRETVVGAPVELSPDQDPGSQPLPDPPASRNLNATQKTHPHQENPPPAQGESRPAARPTRGGPPRKANPKSGHPREWVVQN